MTKFKDFMKNRRLISSVAAIALAAVIGMTGTLQTNQPNFPSYEDPEQTQEIIMEEPALAAKPKVTTTTKTSTKSTEKKITLSKAAKKTETKKSPITKKITTTTKKSSTAKEKKEVKTETLVETQTTEKFTKGSKIKIYKKVQRTTVKTTTTITPIEQAVQKPVTVNLPSYANKADANVLDAWTKLGFTLTINPTVAYSGKYDTKTRSITLRKQDETVYHELGHFVGWIAGNMDTSSAFKSVYAAEKSKYTGTNKTYVTQNSSEYFAESFKDYILAKSTLKSQRPKTYAQIEKAVKAITSARVTLYYNTYKSYWK